MQATNKPASARLGSYRDRLIKRTGGNSLAPVAHGDFLAAISSSAFTAISIVGLVLALSMTVYLVTGRVAPQSLPFHIPMDAELKENLSAGAVFFWLELFGIVGMLRLYDQLRTDRRQRSQIRELQKQVHKIVLEIEGAQDAFIEELDRLATPDGLFDVNLAKLNIKVVDLRRDFMVVTLCDPDLTSYAQPISARILTILDRMAGESYEAVGAAMAAQRAKDTSGVFDELIRLFKVTDPVSQGLSDLSKVLARARKAV